MFKRFGAVMSMDRRWLTVHTGNKEIWICCILVEYCTVACRDSRLRLRMSRRQCWRERSVSVGAWLVLERGGGRSEEPS